MKKGAKKRQTKANALRQPGPGRAPAADAAVSQTPSVIPVSRSIRLMWLLTPNSGVDYHYELSDASPSPYRVQLNTARIASRMYQVAIIDFHDVRDAKAALDRYHGRTHWGVQVTGHFMLPNERVEYRTPCVQPNSQASLCVMVQPQRSAAPQDPSRERWLRRQLERFGEVRPFDLAQESTDGSLVAYVEYFDARDRGRAFTNLSKKKFDGLSMTIQLAWDQSSVRSRRLMPPHLNPLASSQFVSVPISTLNALTQQQYALAQAFQIQQQQQQAAALAGANPMQASSLANPMLLASMMGQGGTGPLPGVYYAPSAAQQQQMQSMQMQMQQQQLQQLQQQHVQQPPMQQQQQPMQFHGMGMGIGQIPQQQHLAFPSFVGGNSSGMMILPAPEEYRYVGTGDIESHDLSANELFRDTVLPGINARFTTRKEIVLFLKKLSDSARQLQTEVAGVFRHFARLHGQHGLATLLESRSNIEAVFRAVLDPNSMDYFEALSDPRLQAAVVAHRRSASRKPIFCPAGSDEFYREVADVFCGAIAFTADQVFQSFMMRLTECLAGHFLKTMDPQARNAMLQADTEASSSHAAMDVVELKMFQRATQQIKFDIQKGLVNANGNHHPLQVIAVLPDLVTGYARVGAVPRGLPYPKLIPTVNELGPYAPLSFKSFCGLFLDGPLLIPELPPVLPCPVDAIKTLIGTKDSPPVAIEAIKESDVEQVEAWLRAGVVHGLASWDVVLGVLHHFIKPEHLWKQVSIDGETRSQRSLVDPIMINGKNLQIHSHHSGIRASVRAFMFPPEPMEALVARIDEWRAHRDQGQLALQVESMTLHDSDDASVTASLE
ncbi:hypothetical protein H9P43_002031 [Blastocladiella emersonii ATCC 22665]|nr:hypothetical protein H9P43_002031 [Blastocladiella emersonii ATCC 22665]